VIVLRIRRKRDCGRELGKFCRKTLDKETSRSTALVVGSWYVRVRFKRVTFKGPRSLTRKGSKGPRVQGSTGSTLARLSQLFQPP
jgi:hypothetical protein